MPKLLCNCGDVIDLSKIPVEGEYSFVEAKQWDEIVHHLVQIVRVADITDQEFLRERISDTLAGFGSYFYKCPHCDELIVFWQGSEKGQAYRLLDDNVMRASE